jgi:hypothetical protein
MRPSKLFVVAATGLAAAACSTTYDTVQPAPAVAVAYRSGAEQACLDYGFQPGTGSYNRCVVREADARAAGRVPATYSMALVTADAQQACSSYGLLAGTGPYDRCVAREVDARRYRDQAAIVAPAPVVYPAPSATVYTAPPSGTVVYSTAPVTYVPAATTPPAGVQAFRDEYGFRYDGQGNRIDRNGNIISPQSTRP